MKAGGQRHAAGGLLPRKDLVFTEQYATCAPGPVRPGADNLAFNGLRSPECPAPSDNVMDNLNG